MHLFLGADSMKMCVILWRSTPRWNIGNPAMFFDRNITKLPSKMMFFTVIILFAFNQRKELVCVPLGWLQTHNVRSSLFLLCDLHSNNMVSEMYYIFFVLRYFPPLDYWLQHFVWVCTFCFYNPYEDEIFSQERTQNSPKWGHFAFCCILMLQVVGCLVHFD